MEICILNSGSSANSTLVKTDETSILIDAGLSGKETIRRLKEKNLDANNLSGILVSHGHRDHINGVGVLARRFNVPVITNRRTYSEIYPIVGDLPKHRFIRTGAKFEIGDISVETFSISHDSQDPMAFVLKTNKTKIAHLTDLGVFTDAILKKIRDSDIIVIESNHDLDMLIHGSYPEHLKRRILGPKGHLSNIAAANALVEAVGSKTNHIILAHLSENNNEPELVQSTVSEILDEEGLSDIDLIIASRYEAMEPIVL